MEQPNFTELFESEFDKRTSETHFYLMGIDGGLVVQNSIQFAYVDGSYFRAFQVKRISGTTQAHVIRALADITNSIALFSVTKIDLRRRSENIAIAADVLNNIKHTPSIELEEFEETLRGSFVLYLTKTLENADFRVKLSPADVVDSKKCWVVRNDVGVLKRVALKLSDEDKERYRKIKWHIDECDLF